MRINKNSAMQLVRRAAARSEAPADWVAKVSELSRLCDEGISKTHLAFLPTAMLARACDGRADLYAIKPNHAKNDEGAYSARVLCHGVLVPLSAELGFSLGVTGREPLNNQPYFRMTRLDDGTPVHRGGRAAFDYMLSLVRELEALTESEAEGALAAFIQVRKAYQPNYGLQDGTLTLRPNQLAEVIRRFVANNSENGKRAQAVAAGLMDVVFGPARVESGRINDPSRRYPGDVCVVNVSGEKWKKAIEVRDKPVAISDVQIFGKKCLDLGVLDASVLMVAESQPKLDLTALENWAQPFGLGLTLFSGWAGIVEQVLYWSPDPKPLAARNAISAIHLRLVAVESSEAAVALWTSMILAYAKTEGDIILGVPKSKT